MKMKVQLQVSSLLVPIFFGACTIVKPCPDTIGFNTIYDSSCKVRIRNVYVGDSINPELKSRFIDNPTTTVGWVGTVNENGNITPGHFIILNASGKAAK